MHTHVPSRISYALSNGILGLTWCRRVLLNFRKNPKNPRICFVKSDFLSCWKWSRKSPNTVFVYSKSEYTAKIGQCVHPSVRLFDNSSQLHSIDLKFCAHNCLINIKVEFEDEKDSSRNGWVIEKIVIFYQTIPEEEYRDFFKKITFFSIIHNIPKSTRFLQYT
jgi:hypothetical protein